MLERQVTETEQVEGLIEGLLSVMEALQQVLVLSERRLQLVTYQDAKFAVSGALSRLSAVNVPTIRGTIPYRSSSSANTA